MSKLIPIILLLIFTLPAISQDTTLKLYRAYGETEPLIIEKEVHGSCWEQSHYLKREDAWRCQAENKTYDPCFIKPFGNQKEAICPHSPWEKASIKINLSEQVDNTNHNPLDMSRTYPWAIELVGGEKCYAIDEQPLYEGLQVRYQCEDKTMLFGSLQRCKSPWKILQRTKNNSVDDVKTVVITEAWF